MKLIITINDGTLAGQQFDLTSGHLSIGRNEHCSIKFNPLTEKIASKQHAFLEAKPDGFYLTDNNSTNGTLVNGQRIKSQMLNSGDSIQFGTNGITATVIIDVAQNTASDFASPTFVQENPQLTVDEIKISPTEQTPDEFQIGQTQQSPGEYIGQSHQEPDEILFDQIQQPVVNLAVTGPPTSFMQSVSTIGFGTEHEKPEAVKYFLAIYIGIFFTFLIIFFLTIMVTGLIVLSIGVVPAIIAAVVAFVPATFYIFPIKWLDRYDPEPIWLLFLAFAWGALVAVLISFFANTFVGIGVTVLIDPTAGNLAGAVLAAPFFEELTKGAGLLVVILFCRKYFDGILDGIIFAGVIALGFATVENVLYYGRALNDGGTNGLMIVFFMRGILSPFAHVTFTAMTGIGFGLARESHNKLVKYTMPLVGLGAAMFLHACWNGVAMLLGGGFLIFYLVIEIPFFLAFVGFAFWIMWRQNKIIREMLAIDVAQGVIPKDHFERATSAFKSLIWIIGSIFKGKYWATTRYIRAIGKYGLSYWHIQRAKAAQGETMSYQQNPILRDEVLKWRDKV